MMNHQEVINRIKQVAAQVLPKGSTVYLYGSRAKDFWYNGPHSMFYFNVEEDKILLYESSLTD